MMKRLYILYIIASLLVLSSCLKEEYPDNEYKNRLVVEGYIEQDSFAKVMLTFNMQPSEEISEETLRDKIAMSMKVSVTEIINGVETNNEVLIGRIDKKYPTQFIYTSSRIIGKVGAKYRLDIIEYGGREWTAMTTIPAPNELYNLTAEKVDDKFYRVKATIKPNADNLPYMIRCETSFTEKERPYYFPLALFGVIERCDQETVITINRPLDYENILEYSTLFLHQEDLYIQFCTMPEFGFKYWSTWENCTLNSLNPVFPVDETPPTNIIGDASGIWIGYGTSYYVVKNRLQ